jgi:hypothetical protein
LLPKLLNELKIGSFEIIRNTNEGFRFCIAYKFSMNLVSKCTPYAVACLLLQIHHRQSNGNIKCAHAVCSFVKYSRNLAALMAPQLAYRYNFSHLHIAFYILFIDIPKR